MTTVTELPMLSDEECAGVVATLNALRPHWRQRLPDVPFYTLGAASYLDAVRPGYRALAAATNPIFVGELAWLHQRLRDTLAGHLGAKVEFHERAALPGFHIFLAHAAFLKPMGSIHKDLQYEHLDWSGFDAPDFTEPLSFTLAIALPKNGGGLNRWVRDPSLPPPTAPVPRAKLTDGLTKTYHPYTCGTLALHSGRDVHQIAPASEIAPGDQRITLQGHGIKAGGTWWLYW